MTDLSPTSTSNGVRPVSPRMTATPKNVSFELLFTESPQYRARLPMRVQIYPHDTTDSIVTTVKNFYGLYSSPTNSKGVSFEDEQGNTLIARYENFHNNMIVYVRVIDEVTEDSAAFGPHPLPPTAVGVQAFYNGQGGYPQHAPQASVGHDSRPNSRASRRRSPSPSSNRGRGRRSASANTNPASSKTGRSRSSKTRAASNQGSTEAYDALGGYSSGDGAPGSSASGKAKEQIGTTEISVDNIVEGGRRKRAKFESSELPLFAPPQMPAATSNPSVSPARRMDQHRSSLSYFPGAANPFTNPQPLQSPQNYNTGFGQRMYTTPNGHRSSGSIGYGTNGTHAPGNGPGGILPTPDPTVGSCVSEEDKDVAIQLMRLGDISNISHGRTSASTLDDTFSGRADVASSTGATSEGGSESDDDQPPARRQKLESGANIPMFEAAAEGRFAPNVDGAQNTHASMGSATGFDMLAPPKTKANGQPTSKMSKTNKAGKGAKNSRPVAGIKTNNKKTGAISSTPMSPSSLPPSRKPSISSGSTGVHPSIEEEPDLSTKPRCQRCRKSKKGCDRQRPCGRCKDAGLSADQCISEDEGNGRKGRYGRHMGVPIKREDMPAPPQPTLLPAAPIMANPDTFLDKSKKRKR